MGDVLIVHLGIMTLAVLYWTAWEFGYARAARARTALVLQMMLLSTIKNPRGK